MAQGILKFQNKFHLKTLSNEFLSFHQKPAHQQLFCRLTILLDFHANAVLLIWHSNAFFKWIIAYANWTEYLQPFNWHRDVEETAIPTISKQMGSS